MVLGDEALSGGTETGQADEADGARGRDLRDAVAPADRDRVT